MEKIDKLIVGLGNPGRKYMNTRHNIGYRVAYNYVLKYNFAFKTELNIAEYSIITIKTKEIEKNILVVLPLTYMNKSGIAVNHFITKYNIPTEDMLIVLDEYNFPLTKIHIKKVSSYGGHNGLNSIMTATNDKKFHILRCGIGNNFAPGELADYVLSKFDTEEKENVKETIKNAGTAIDFYINNEIGKTLSYINSGEYLKNDV